MQQDDVMVDRRGSAVYTATHPALPPAGHALTPHNLRHFFYGDINKRTWWAIPLDNTTVQGTRERVYLPKSTYKILPCARASAQRERERAAATGQLLAGQFWPHLPKVQTPPMTSLNTPSSLLTTLLPLLTV